MYWPIGAPRIHAATSSNNSRARDAKLRPSDDGLEDTSEPPSEGSGSLIEAPGQSTEESLQGHEDEEENGAGAADGLLSPTTPITPGIKPVEHDFSRRSSAKPFGNGDATAAAAAEGGVPKGAETESILSLKLSRSGHLFATITATSLTVWQTKPTAILAVVVRSESSLSKYGTNVALLVRPDSAIFVVQTTMSYLITYSLATDPNSRVYKPVLPNQTGLQSRRQSISGLRDLGVERALGAPDGAGLREVSIKFRMVIKVDAGIGKALALDEELVVAILKPAGAQCIRWTPDSTGNQTNTELFSRIGWIPKKVAVVDMIHDRPMNLSTWITSDGKAFAVQRISEPGDSELQKVKDSKTNDADFDASKAEAPKTKIHKKLFRGYCFHNPARTDENGVKAAVNARFSLIAIGCMDGSVKVYTARDYVGNIPVSHVQRLSVSQMQSGNITFLSYSPDGYCLFVGYEKGWAMWSVYGKAGSNSFSANKSISDANDEAWLHGVKEGVWLGGGSEILLVGMNDDRLWALEMARSAVTSNFSSANICRTLLQTKSGIMVYQGYDLPDLATISAEASQWHNAQIPPSYLFSQWPIRHAVISLDGRYVALAGRRGLTHYSVASGRWKTFANENMQASFQVRGGLCWYKHILVAAVECGDNYEIQLFSRELALDTGLILCRERLPAPVVLITPSGDDSLLVYTYDNLMHHYIFSATENSVQMIQVGQIAFNGIVRSPARVRGLSWILPEEQLQEGDPSQDVAVATVLFLVDGKLVLLQPSVNEQKRLKYDMRVIAQNVEYYVLSRDQAHLVIHSNVSEHSSQIAGDLPSHGAARTLRDSLWLFDGNEIKLWPDVTGVLRWTPADLGRDLPPTVACPVDFYPLSVLLGKGILLGVEPDLIQRRDVGFAFFRFSLRTHLFISQILKFHISRYDSTAALHLASQYRDIEYFAHALEILLHDVLDEEVDTSPTPERALLPGVLSLLSSFPQYLDIVVQCTRKTEVRSWRTLFAYLPPPQELFEESLQKGALKTAGGYLLILHTFEELSSSSEQLVRLLSRARDEGDWDLCKELARFLMALDDTGTTLREALAMVNLRSPQEGSGAGKSSSFLFENSRLQVPSAKRRGVRSDSSHDTDSVGRSGSDESDGDSSSRSGSQSPLSRPLGGSLTKEKENE